MKLEMNKKEITRSGIPMRSPCLHTIKYFIRPLGKKLAFPQEIVLFRNREGGVTAASLAIM